MLSINLYGLSGDVGRAAQASAAAQVRASLSGEGWVLCDHGSQSYASRNTGRAELAAYHWRDGPLGQVQIVAYRPSLHSVQGKH